MKTVLEKDLESIESDWFDEEFPIGIIGMVLFSIVMTLLLALTYDWSDLTKLQIGQHIVLLIGFAVYFGRQLFDISWLYLILSDKDRYQTIGEKQQIAYYKTKHAVRFVYLVGLALAIYFLHSSMDLLWSIPVFISFFLLPIVYRILANKSKQKVEQDAKKNPVQRISVDGKIDLSHLPFLLENLETQTIANEEVKKSYKEIQSLLDYVTIRVSLIEDLEIVHTLKRMGEEELPRLLKEYIDLESDLQKNYEGKVLSYLSLIENKLLSYKKMIDDKKTQNIQTTFSLLDERYKA